MYFDFETDFVEPNIRCIPMIVRFKLDACGVKLKLAEWSRMTPEERQRFAEAPCVTPEEIRRYREDLRQLILERTGNAVSEFPVEENPGWKSTNTIPLSVAEKFAETGSSLSLEAWAGLTDLQRFALLKLSRPGHENKNFPKAVVEFKLRIANYE